MGVGEDAEDGVVGGTSVAEVGLGVGPVKELEAGVGGGATAGAEGGEDLKDEGRGGKGTGRRQYRCRIRRRRRS